MESGGAGGDEHDPGDSSRPPPSEIDSDRQRIYERATSAQKSRYTELMRHDPIAGMAYLEALALLEEPLDHRHDL